SFSSGGLPVGPPFLMNEKLRCIHRSGNALVAHEYHPCSSQQVFHCNGFDFNATNPTHHVAMNEE
ncbi:hypothetical protein ABT234_37225, partial [Streptomyces sp. NPDC001586]|uniref:hypothetical protein n=1 Tax=Streptomyces sp. NPDC001586 TaxID=3154387 RepID=UPI00332C4454